MIHRLLTYQLTSSGDDCEIDCAVSGAFLGSKDQHGMNKKNTSSDCSNSAVPSVRLLRINRFRGIERLEWQPSPQLNVIVGPGDSCKSTILEALGLLFSPAPTVNLSEFDYFNRDVREGFTIEAAVAVGNGDLLKQDKFPLPPLQGWCEGKLTDLPDENGAEAVLVCRLTGTPDLEAIYEVAGAGDEVRVMLSRALRQRLGLIRLGVADRGDRDLRLVQGGALHRFMEGLDVRHAVLQAILKTSIHDQLEREPREALKQIEDRFQKRSLPHPIRLGLIGTPGVSLAASVGLMVGATDQSALPLPAWGSGTRRLAALELATILTNSASIAIVDEPETGLEPYRQRAFIGDLYQEGKRQGFVTTHAPAILSATAYAGGSIWRLDSNAQITLPPDRDDVLLEASEESSSHEVVRLASSELMSLIEREPETVFARVPVICEGATEQGFATRLLIDRFGPDYHTRGIHCVDAGGNDAALTICRKLIKARFRVAAIVDDEGRKRGSWRDVQNSAVLLQWEDRTNLERAVFTALPDHILPTVVTWPEEFGGKEERHCLSDVRRALGVTEKDKTARELFNQVGRERFLDALSSAACPPRESGKKPKGWFKSFDGGYLLADKTLHVEPKAERILAPINEFLAALEASSAA